MPQEQEFLKAWVESDLRCGEAGQVGYDAVAGHRSIEFRSVTVTTVKGEGKEYIDRGHAVIYRGTYEKFRDEDGYIFPRGERIAACERTSA